MAFTRITNEELESRGATTLPDAPTIPANQLKQEFDAPAKEIVAPAVNHLMEELEASTAAGSIGVTPPQGRSGSNLQDLLNDISGTGNTLILRQNVTVSAGGTVRIPASGTDSHILPSSACIVEPICDLKSNGTPYAFKSCVVSLGYVTITMAEAISDVTIGVRVTNI